MPTQFDEKIATRRILISEPDEDQLIKGLEGRNLSPDLSLFLKRLVKTNKWMRKINIPSCHDDLAAALVFASELKGAGLEIFSELHVFWRGRIMIEKWQVVGETDQRSSLSRDIFTAAEVDKVRGEGMTVQVEIGVPDAEGGYQIAVRTFDFSDHELVSVRVVPHPLAKSPA